MQNKMYTLLVALLASVAFVGCTSDDVTDGGATTQLSFSAVADGGNVSNHASERMKTQLHPNEGNSVTFCSGDAISVFDGTTQQNKRFATKTSGASVTFSGAAPESQNYTALYPYQEGATISDGVISAVLPTTQYAQTGTTYDPQAALSVATTTRDAMTFAFKNVCGLVKFTTTEPLAKIVFKGNSGEKVAGNVSIAVSTEPTATSSDATSITLLPAEGASSIPAGTYYIAVLPQTFAQGLTVESYKVGSTTADQVLRIAKSITLTRSYIINLGYLAANGYEFVDLGFTVTEADGKTYKILWATKNVGANVETDLGDYYDWGVTTPRTVGQNTLYTPVEGCNVTDGTTQYSIEHDAAHVQWGGAWEVPTAEDWAALVANTTKSNDTKGYRYTSKIDDSQSIFLPAAGALTETGARNSLNTWAYYWSKTVGTKNTSEAANFCYNGGGGKGQLVNTSRKYGQSIRPVLRIPVSQ